MRPTLRDVIQRARNEIENLPDGAFDGAFPPMIDNTSLVMELAREYEREGRTARQRETTLVSDIRDLFLCYEGSKLSYQMSGETQRKKEAYKCGTFRMMIDGLLYTTGRMGLHLPQDELKRYDSIELWVQDIKPFLSQLYGENTDIPTTDKHSHTKAQETQKSTFLPSSYPFSFKNKLPLKQMYIDLRKANIIKDILEDDFIQHVKRADFSNITTSKVSAKRLVSFFGECATERVNYRTKGAEFLGVSVKALSGGEISKKFNEILTKWNGLLDE